ncbi:hypothetical protein FAZ69_26955 [Trinickia terrae]|uniref:Avirulence protein n=1 Tax=Trinickia terrae TaxID=2571161 RepID=A0A4U1HK89_9BURK|nr:XopAH/AvrB family type III secretion system effector [Trinickia terrae]TKC81611.1 hypothetical protein FAZ69_26955 [Trinickia terrae]
MDNRIVTPRAHTVDLDRSSGNSANTGAAPQPATRPAPRSGGSGWLHGLRSLGKRHGESSQPAVPGAAGPARKTSSLPAPLRHAIDGMTAGKQRKTASRLTDAQLELALSSTKLTGRATRAVLREHQKRHVDSGNGAAARAATLPGPPPSPRLTEQEQGLVGAARWPDIYDQSATPQNQEYCRSMYRASSAAASGVASGGIKSFDALWNAATDWRLERVGADTPGREAFATERSAGSVFNTKLDMQYASIIPKILDHRRAAARTYDGPLLAGVRCKVYQQTGKLDGRTIPLTTLSAATDKRELAQKMGQVYEQHDDFEEIEDSLNRRHPNNIVHTDAQYLPRIKQHLESLFAQATRGTLAPKDALRTIARIHWWAASAAPDMRGSAAKAEFAARALAGAHGIELPPFKKGVVPDIEAMLCSESEFVARYSSLFERKPV